MIIYALYNIIVPFIDFYWVKLAWRWAIAALVYWFYKHVMKNNVELLWKAHRGAILLWVIITIVKFIVNAFTSDKDAVMMLYKTLGSVVILVIYLFSIRKFAKAARSLRDDYGLKLPKNGCTLERGHEHG